MLLDPGLIIQFRESNIKHFFLFFYMSGFSICIKKIIGKIFMHETKKKKHLRKKF